MTDFEDVAETVREIAKRDREIERLKAERDAAIKEIGKWSREAGASQAREAKLREAIILCKYAAGHPDKVYEITKNALALPTDDTALKELLAEGQARYAKVISTIDAYSKARFHEWKGDPTSEYYRSTYMEGMVDASDDILAHVLKLPHDDTAMKEALKQAKREALLEAANICEEYTWVDELQCKLRKMADEL